jgi:hypothetical protein
MSGDLSYVISGAALAVSSVTAWLTFFRRGEVKMTKPTVVFFGPDGDAGREQRPRPKVFLRTLLYSTSKAGQMVESMHVSLQRGESRQNFSIWVYGDKDNLARGSGLFVGPDGIACNHHFLLPDDAADFKFAAGEYTVRIYAKRVRDRSPRLMYEIKLSVSESDGTNLRNGDAGLYFDWGPDQEAYHPHVDIRKQPPIPAILFDANPRKK